MNADDRSSLDAVLEPAYITDRDSLGTDELRARRDEAREQEEILSYVRRLVHGKLDILRHELSSRREGAEPQEVVARLSAILADKVTGPGRGARSGLPNERVQAAGRHQVERLVSSDSLARLPDLGVEEIEQLVERLVGEERAVSERRRRVHVVVDELSSELARRYREGAASVDDLLGGPRGTAEERA